MMSDKIINHINENTEAQFIWALREYYQQNFVNGESLEAFLLWIEGMLVENYEVGMIENYEEMTNGLHD